MDAGGFLLSAVRAVKARELQVEGKRDAVDIGVSISPCQEEPSQSDGAMMLFPDRVRMLFLLPS